MGGKQDRVSSSVEVWRGAEAPTVKAAKWSEYRIEEIDVL